MEKELLNIKKLFFLLFDLTANFKKLPVYNKINLKTIQMKHIRHSK